MAVAVEALEPTMTIEGLRVMGLEVEGVLDELYPPALHLA